MEDPRVFIVLLRRPSRGKKHLGEMRSDPFWEFGSFGCTGCHRKNLLHPRNAQALVGHRLAFAQGGPSGFRLVFLTPSVTEVRQGAAHFEAMWKPCEMPFKYLHAPILVANDGHSDVPSLKAFVNNADRPTLESRFSSCFRSRTKPVNATIASEIVAAYDGAREKSDSKIAVTYNEALPYDPPTIDRNREGTYCSLRGYVAS